MATKENRREIIFMSTSWEIRPKMRARGKHYDTNSQADIVKL